MKLIKLLIIQIFVGIIFMPYAKTQTDIKTIQEIETALTYYLDGGTFGDSLLFSKAFVPQGQMLSIRNDSLKIISLKDFTAGAKNDGVRQNRKTKIENIQVFGNMASAKLTIEYPTFYFHDMMSLLKTDKGWRIVAKVFFKESK